MLPWRSNPTLMHMDSTNWNQLGGEREHKVGRGTWESGLRRVGGGEPGVDVI